MIRANVHKVAAELRSVYSRRAKGEKKTREDCYAASYQLAVDRGYGDPEGIAKAVCELFGHCCESAADLVKRVLAEGFSNNPNKKKYTTKPYFGKLRIVALRSFGDVIAGQEGGLISREANLSQSGDCWVYPWAQAIEECTVSHSAKVRNEAIIRGFAVIRDKAVVGENAEVFGHAIVRQNAYVGGNATVYAYADISGNAAVTGDANVGSVYLNCSSISTGTHE